MNYWLTFDTNKMQKLIRLRQKQRKYIRIVDFFDKTRFIFSSTSNYYKALKISWWYSWQNAGSCDYNVVLFSFFYYYGDYIL